MTPTETVLLVRYVKACCPHQQMDEYTPDAWHDLLGDLDLNDAKSAVVAVAKRQPFVAPAEIRAEVKRAREDRLARNPLPAPDAELADAPGKYQRAVQTSVRRIADGMAVPRAIGGGKPLEGAPPAEWTAAKEALTEAVRPEPKDPREIARRQAEESRRSREAS